MNFIIPENNSLRFVRRQYYQQPNGSTFTEFDAPHDRNYSNSLLKDEIRLNQDLEIKFLEQLYGDNENYLIQHFTSDRLKVQALSDVAMTLTNTRVRIAKYDGTVLTGMFTIGKRVDNKAQLVKYGRLKIVEVAQTGDNKVGLYFTQDLGTNLTLREIQHTDTTIPSIVALDKVLSVHRRYYEGSLPDNLNDVAVLKKLTIIDDVVPQEIHNDIDILEKYYDPALNAIVIVTDKNWSYTAGTAIIDFEYERGAKDVYEISIKDLPVNECFAIEIQTSIDEFTNVYDYWESDYIYIDPNLSGGFLKFNWNQLGSVYDDFIVSSIYDNFQNKSQKFLLDFRTNIQNECYLYGLLYELQPEGDVEVYTDNQGNAIQLDSEYRRVFKLEFQALPRHLIEKINLIIRHNTVFINGKKYTYQPDSFSTEKIENTMLQSAELSLIECEHTGIYSDDVKITVPPIAPSPEGGIKFGFLYNYFAVQPLLINGDTLLFDPDTSEFVSWRVPSFEEDSGEPDYDFSIAKLKDYLVAEEVVTFVSWGENDLGKVLKASGTDYWNNDNGTDDVNLGLRGCGWRDGGSGEFSQLKQVSGFWTTTLDGDDAVGFGTNNDENQIVYATDAEFKKVGGAIILVRKALVSEAALADGAETTPYIDNTGKEYKAVKIGTQVWLAEPLAETKYYNGSLIPFITNNADWMLVGENEIDAVCAYNNDNNNAYE